jgi:dCMP deaminase
MSKWNIRWFALANLAASWSEDRSRGTGAVIVDDDNRLLSIGWNGLPRGIAQEESRLRAPAKYIWTEHAERNAIYNCAAAGTPTKGATIFLNWFPCADCARAIVQSGIRAVWCREPDWTSTKYSFREAEAILIEGGVDISFGIGPDVGE